MKNPIKYIFSLLTLAVLAFGPPAARADTLYATANNGLYQFNTAVSPASQSTVTNIFGSVTTVVAVDSHGNVFFATDGNFSTDFGDIYEITTNGLMQEVATGLYQPQSLAFDSQGNLFELDNYSDSGQNINEFVNTGGVLSSTPVVFASGADVIGPGYPLNGLAFDSTGDLFVASYYGTYEFTSTAGTLSSVATLFSYDGSYGLAFDSSGDLFVGYYGIVEYVNAAGTLSSTPMTVYNGGYAYNMAFDSQGNLFVSDLATGDGNIYEFTNNGGTLSSTPVTVASGLYAGGLAFLPVAPPPKLYVPYLFVAGNKSIYAFNPAFGSGSQSTIASGLSFEPAGMAVDSQGNLFASDGVSTIYKIPANGVPVAFATGLSEPLGLAFDTNGDLFEADSGSYNIYEFTNNAGTLSTTPTLFYSIYGVVESLAFDSHGDLLLADLSYEEVIEFPNIAGTLYPYAQAPFGSLGFANSLAVDANGDLFVGYADGDYEEPPYNGVILEYVNNNSAKWYNGGVLSTTPITIATANVAGLACDPNGNLYEVDGDDGNVYEFTNNAGIPSHNRTLYASGLGATCEAINLGVQTNAAPQPNLYVIESDGPIYSFNTTNGAATQALFRGGVNGNSYGNLAFDNPGDLFISDYYYLYEVTNNAGTLSASNQIPINEEGVSFGCGGGVAFDYSGNLFVGDYMYPGINKLTPTGTAGVWNNFPLDDPNPFLQPGGFPYSLAFDNNRVNLFDAGGGYLMEFGNLGAPPDQTTRLVFPASNYGAYSGGVAIDGNGNLFVGQGYAISEFTNTPTGVSTNQTLFSEDFDNVTSLAFDAGGNLFAADGDSGNVIEFINTGGVLSSYPVYFASVPGASGLAIYIAPGVPVPPQLNFVPSGPALGGGGGSPLTQLVFAWPSSATGFVVQTNGDLSTTNWANYGGAVQSYQGTNSMTITLSTGNLFFRLAHP